MNKQSLRSLGDLKKFLLVIILILLVGLFWLFTQSESKTVSFSSPQATNISESIPTPIPSQVPTSYKFDRSTDLENELEGVDPQVLESDFE